MSTDYFSTRAMNGRIRRSLAIVTALTKTPRDEMTDEQYDALGEALQEIVGCAVAISDDYSLYI